MLRLTLTILDFVHMTFLFAKSISGASFSSIAQLYYLRFKSSIKSLCKPLRSVANKYDHLSRNAGTWSKAECMIVLSLCSVFNSPVLQFIRITFIVVSAI